MGVMNVDYKRQIWKVAETVAEFPAFVTSNFFREINPKLQLKISLLSEYSRACRTLT